MKSALRENSLVGKLMKTLTRTVKSALREFGREAYENAAEDWEIGLQGQK